MSGIAAPLSPPALRLLLDDHARGEHRDSPEPACPDCAIGAEPDASDELIALSASAEVA